MPELTPVSHEFYQFLLAHMLFGIGASLTYAPATSVAPHWFLRHRSTAVGIIVCGAGLGGVVYPIMIKQLTDRLGELTRLSRSLCASVP